MTHRNVGRPTQLLLSLTFGYVASREEEVDQQKVLLGKQYPAVQIRWIIPFYSNEIKVYLEQKSCILWLVNWGYNSLFSSEVSGETL